MSNVKILVVKEDGQVEQEFTKIPTRGGEWHMLALDIQRAAKRAEGPGAGEGKTLVPMVDFIGPAFTLLGRAEATAELANLQGDALRGVIEHFNSVLDTDVRNWKREELYKLILDWKIELVLYLSEILRNFAEETGEVNVDTSNGNT